MKHIFLEVLADYKHWIHSLISACKRFFLFGIGKKAKHYGRMNTICMFHWVGFVSNHIWPVLESFILMQK